MQNDFSDVELGDRAAGPHCFNTHHMTSCKEYIEDPSPRRRISTLKSIHDKCVLHNNPTGSFWLDIESPFRVPSSRGEQARTLLAALSLSSYQENAHLLRMPHSQL